MATTLSCPDTAEDLWNRNACVYAVSKNAEGALDLLEREREECPDRGCTVLKTRHVIKLKVSGNEPCDSRESSPLDGRFYAVNLVHVFDGDGTGRGIHAGDFRWGGGGLTATGRLSGVTNAGTHRQPVFDDCQRCDAQGWMEGRFCGTIVRAADARFLGCALLGTYRFRFDPAAGGAEGAIRGTLEGAIVCDCARDCVDFRGFATTTGPNPRTESGVEFTVFDHTGTPTPTSEIRTWGALTGLNLGFSTQIQLPAPTSSVEVTLAHFAQPARVDAHDAAGTLVGSAVMSGPQNTAETLVISGPQISRVEITAPQNETLLLALCR